MGHSGLPVQPDRGYLGDRQAGMSNFKLAGWIPRYLRWYRFAFGPKLTAEQIRSRGETTDQRR